MLFRSFMVTALPVLIFFVLFNIAWTVWAVRRGDAQRANLVISAFVGMVWIAEFSGLRYL